MMKALWFLTFLFATATARPDVRHIRSTNGELTSHAMDIALKERKGNNNLPEQCYSSTRQTIRRSILTDCWLMSLPICFAIIQNSTASWPNTAQKLVFQWSLTFTAMAAALVA